MEGCFLGGCKLAGTFYQSHSLGTDVAATFIGSQVAVRGSSAIARSLFRPLTERIGAAYHTTVRKLKNKFVVPIWVYTAPASICCLEEVVREFVKRRREADLAVPSKPRISTAKPVLTPYYDSELGGHVIYEHASSVPIRLRVKEVDSNGVVR